MTTLLEQFSDLTDPRTRRTEHLLIDIVMIAVLAVICGADDWVAVEAFGRSKEEWLRTFLTLPYGIPSHDTFNRFFLLLSPKEFAERFQRWTERIAQRLPGHVAIDGKTVRRSRDGATGKAAIHLVSAFATANRLVLAQVKTEEKSNEITAIPEVLRSLMLEGCVVTIDAMGCQKAIAEQIVEAGADYVLQVKGNHPRLLGELETFFKDAQVTDFEEVEHDHIETKDAAHDRNEVRRVWCTDWVDWLPGRTDWKGLSSLIFVERHRQVLSKAPSVEVSYYLSSLSNPTAAQAANLVRSHWGIENSCHWILDIAFREDECRLRKGHGAENFGTIRRGVLNLLQQEKTAKMGIHNKRLRAAWDTAYLFKVVGL
jgi:predicted transposase YbfD/YdcC